MIQDALSGIRRTIARLLPSSRRTNLQGEGDPVAAKLKDLQWAQDEDDEEVGRVLAESAAKSRGNADDLATTTFRGRPQNPFSDDF